MTENFEILKLEILPTQDLQPLLVESREEGFEFVERLEREYLNGINPFKKRGEALFGVYRKQQLIAIGGLNIDPYAEDDLVGRVRHVYVLSGWRRKGVGKIFIQKERFISHERKAEFLKETRLFGIFILIFVGDFYNQSFNFFEQHIHFCENGINGFV